MEIPILKEKPKTMIGIPSMGTVRSELATWLIKYGTHAANRIEIVLNGRPEHIARNILVETFLKSDCQKLWMIDSDVLPPNNAAQLLFLDHPLIAPVCYYVDFEGELVSVFDSNLGKVKDHRTLDEFSLVDATGAGSLIIDRSVFERLETPYFDWATNPECTKVYRGEDIYFSMNCNEVGIKTLLVRDFLFLHRRLKEMPTGIDFNMYIMDKRSN